MHILIWYVLPILVLPCIIGGIVGQIKNDPSFARKLNDWPRYKHNLPRDSHAKARQDGAFVDGIITGAVLDDLDELFK